MPRTIFPFTAQDVSALARRSTASSKPSTANSATCGCSTSWRAPPATRTFSIFARSSLTRDRLDGPPAPPDPVDYLQVERVARHFDEPDALFAGQQGKPPVAVPVEPLGAASVWTNAERATDQPDPQRQPSVRRPRAAAPGALRSWTAVTHRGRSGVSANRTPSSAGSNYADPASRSARARSTDRRPGLLSATCLSARQAAQPRILTCLPL